MMTRKRGALLVCLFLIWTGICAGAIAQDNDKAKAKPVRILMQTELGEIIVEIDAARAPRTAENFLRYVDAGHYNGGRFHRTVKLDNQPASPVKIEVIQAGVNP